MALKESRVLGRFFQDDEKGASMVEYALLASLIAVAAISSVTQLGQNTKDTFSNVGDEMEDALASAGVGRPVVPPGPPGPP